jgi:hypothetical protein
MKKPQILALIFIFSVALTSLTLYKTKISVATRGKVVPDTKSKIFNLKLDEASFLSLENLEDSTDIIVGQICILGSEDEPTGEFIEMVPRKFPKWFVFGCDDEGTIISYKIVEMGNGDSKALVKFSKKQEKGASKE